MIVNDLSTNTSYSILTITYNIKKQRKGELCYSENMSKANGKEAIRQHPSHDSGRHRTYIGALTPREIRLKELEHDLIVFYSALFSYSLMTEAELDQLNQIKHAVETRFSQEK